jgi:hypothetical protein
MRSGLPLFHFDDGAANDIARTYLHHDLHKFDRLFGSNKQATPSLDNPHR